MLLKKLFRTLWQYKAQFISMVILVALGIGMVYTLKSRIKEIRSGEEDDLGNY